MSKSLPEQYKARTHIKSPFTRESLVDKGVMASTGIERETDLLPYVNIIGIGGRSILDRGRSAILPLVDEIVQNKDSHKMILGVAGGIRELILMLSRWILAYPPAAWPI